MPHVRANGLEFEYDTFGEPGGAPLLLIMGLGAQMIAWDEEFCGLLAGRGFHVTRFDNRDIGLSTRLSHLGVPDVQRVLAGAEPPAYRLEDMADDAAGVMEGLGIEAAHVVGASMGGFIAQLLAIHHRERVLSLTSIMSASGGMADGEPASPEAIAILQTPLPADREGLIEHGVNSSRILCGPVFFDEAEARRRRVRAVDRAVSADGMARQLTAIAAAGSRLEALAALDLPALVIHGDADPLVRVEDGRRTAAAIPGARLLVLPDMGHDLPRTYWPRIVSTIADLAGLPPDGA